MAFDRQLQAFPPWPTTHLYKDVAAGVKEQTPFSGGSRQLPGPSTIRGLLRQPSGNQPASQEPPGPVACRGPG